MPLAIYLPRKTKKDKRVSLSLNTYRNLHYLVSNKVKKIYKEEVEKQVAGFALVYPIRLECVYYANDNRDTDLDNWCVIQTKFFCDALVELWYIPDDNTKYIPDIHYRFWGIDKKKWRCEIYCYEV